MQKVVVETRGQSRKPEIRTISIPHPHERMRQHEQTRSDRLAGPCYFTLGNMQSGGSGNRRGGKFYG